MRKIFRSTTLAGCLVATLTLLAAAAFSQSSTGTGSGRTTQSGKQYESKIRGPVKTVVRDKTGRRRAAPSEPAAPVQLQTQSNETAPSGENLDAPSASAPAQYCGGGQLLLKDTIGGIRIFLYGFEPNQTYIEVSQQTAPGTLAFSLTFDGTYTETVQVPVAVGADGNGVSELFFVQGMQLGQSTVHFCDSENGCTTTIDYQVLPQCNCPPIPVIP